ncbi:Protein YELLOW LEAF 1, choloroplastic [Cardamine amara subsp. amara]|uniref:Protein YELLOW LEAF 1, choloroplastic n=1 Tax=Cardamine amara subsp. amara TaxID=228776 RepID=A0ABD1AE50_CARAN
MPVMNPSLCIGAQPLVHLPPRGNHFSSNGYFHGRYYPMQAQPLNQRKFPSVLAVATGAVQPVASKGFGFVSKSKRAVFACNSALNSKCSQGQTQTVTRQTPTITKAPTHGTDKTPKLDDGGRGFPPRDDGGGGGGGGGGGSSSGGFYLFGFLLFMGYLKDLEGEHENH